MGSINVNSGKASIINKKNFVSGGIRTHALIRGPEYPEGKLAPFTLESGALDRSATLT